MDDTRRAVIYGAAARAGTRDDTLLLMAEARSAMKVVTLHFSLSLSLPDEKERGRKGGHVHKRPAIHEQHPLPGGEKGGGRGERLIPGVFAGRLMNARARARARVLRRVGFLIVDQKSSRGNP